MIALRSRGVGILTVGGSRAGPCGWPDCPGSGIAYDCRENHPTYQKLGFVPITRPDCDNYAE